MWLENQASLLEAAAKAPMAPPIAKSHARKATLGFVVGYLGGLKRFGQGKIRGPESRRAVRDEQILPNLLWDKEKRMRVHI